MANPEGPVRADLLSFEHLLDEPFYQLVRQQLLADELEKTGAEGASRVRVVHVLPPGNAAYQQSLARPEHRALGGSVSEVWRQLLRRPDRFVSMDSSVFLDPRSPHGSICSVTLTTSSTTSRTVDSAWHLLTRVMSRLAVHRGGV